MSQKVTLDDAIHEIGQAVVSIGHKVAEHNKVLELTLGDTKALAEVIVELKTRLAALEEHVKGMSSVVADIVVACDRERINELFRKVEVLRRDMMDRTDPRLFER